LKSKAGWSIEEKERSRRKSADCSENQNKKQRNFQKNLQLFYLTFLSSKMETEGQAEISKLR